jgi:hypothetical protein
MRLTLTDILLTIFLVLIYRLLQKRTIKDIKNIKNLEEIEDFTEDKETLDLSKLPVIENNIKLHLSKNNNSFDLEKNKLVYKVVRPIKNYIVINKKKFYLKKLLIENNKDIKIKLQIKLHFRDQSNNILNINIPIMKKNNNYLQLFRIGHFDTYQSGKYLINNLPRRVQNVNNKSIIFNIWFYPLVKFINSNTNLIKLDEENLFTKPYYINNKDFNKINEIL